MNFQMFKLVFEKAGEPEINCQHLLDHQKSEFQKNIYFCFIDYAKSLTVWITTNWKILQEMGIPDHLTCLLRNLSAGQEATVRAGHATTDWLQIEQGVCQSCMLSNCLFNACAGTSCGMPAGGSTRWGQGCQEKYQDVQMTPPLWQKAKN